VPIDLIFFCVYLEEFTIDVVTGVVSWWDISYDVKPSLKLNYFTTK
jgi:hypothetical protein